VKRTFWILIATAVGAVFIAMVSGPRVFGAIADAPPAPQTEVKIDNFTFAPATVTIQAGTSVHWVNHDDIPHNVVSDDKSFKSKVMDTDEEFTYTFSKPGTYVYFCSIHPKMTGKVVVQ
jgi:plastocyanin